MSWVFGYLTIGALWAEVGSRGHAKVYKEEVSAKFYLFMVAAWPYLLYDSIKRIFF